VMNAPFSLWALVSILLGLGFTFFSGAVEAWLVDALHYAKYDGALETVMGRGQMVSGAAMLGGSVLGGVIAQVTSLGVPFLMRVGVLVAMFFVAARAMQDLGFTPEPSAHPARDVKKLFDESIDYGLRNRPVDRKSLPGKGEPELGQGRRPFMAAMGHCLQIGDRQVAFAVDGVR